MTRVVVAVVCFALPAFAGPSGPRFDSALTRALEAKVTSKVAFADGQEAAAAYYAKEQLLYLVGHLNGFGGGADIAKAAITVKTAARGEAEYEATFTLAWPKTYTAPARFKTVAPRGTDAKGKLAFFNRYGVDCQSGEEPADAGTFFYYYRPQKAGCSVLKNANPQIATSLQLALAPSSAQTSGKYPEYDRVWEDGRLVVTMIFGTYEDKTASPRDVGVLNFGRSYRALRQYLGTPVTMSPSLAPNAEPGLANPKISMEFLLANGRTVDVELLLIQKSGLYNATAEFLDHYGARTEISDLVAYNGHSGLGSNIRALAKIGRFVKGQYQIFFVNGCDSFTYSDRALEKAHAAVNPDESPAKYFDLISNAMPSQFQDFAQNAVALVRALNDKKATYAQLLGSLGGAQRAIVTGEEDNRFPEPF
jgi:hypothetical protein